MVCENWYFFFHQVFIKSKSDPKLYMKKDKIQNVDLNFLYIDDLIITRSARNLIDDIKR